MRRTSESYAPAVFALILVALFLSCARRAQEDPTKACKERCEVRHIQLIEAAIRPPANL